MRRTERLLWCLLLLVSILGVLKLDERPEKPRRMFQAENGFQTGCLIEAQTICPLLGMGLNETNKTFLRSVCLEDALKTCPERGKLFREWLESGKK